MCFWPFSSSLRKLMFLVILIVPSMTSDQLLGRTAWSDSSIGTHVGMDISHDTHLLMIDINMSQKCTSSSIRSSFNHLLESQPSETAVNSMLFSTDTDQFIHIRNPVYYTLTGISVQFDPQFYWVTGFIGSRTSRLWLELFGLSFSSLWRLLI